MVGCPPPSAMRLGHLGTAAVVHASCEWVAVVDAVLWGLLVFVVVRLPKELNVMVKKQLPPQNSKQQQHHESSRLQRVP